MSASRFWHGSKANRRSEETIACKADGYPLQGRYCVDRRHFSRQHQSPTVLPRGPINRRLGPLAASGKAIWNRQSTIWNRAAAEARDLSHRLRPTIRPGIGAECGQGPAPSPHGGIDALNLPTPLMENVEMEIPRLSKPSAQQYTTATGEKLDVSPVRISIFRRSASHD